MGFAGCHYQFVGIFSCCLAVNQPPESALSNSFLMASTDFGARNDLDMVRRYLISLIVFVLNSHRSYNCEFADHVINSNIS
jgi:hypothetical protein